MCNNRQEVEDICLLVGLGDKMITGFIIFPNPSVENVTITFLEKTSQAILTLLNLSGQEILH